jgi:hypothetical protein
MQKASKNSIIFLCTLATTRFVEYFDNFVEIGQVFLHYRWLSGEVS